MTGAIHDALVYLDAGAAEAAHLSLGLSFFYHSGARAVCSLENASPLDQVHIPTDLCWPCTLAVEFKGGGMFCAHD